MQSGLVKAGPKPASRFCLRGPACEQSSGLKRLPVNNESGKGEGRSNRLPPEAGVFFSRRRRMERGVRVLERLVPPPHS